MAQETDRKYMSRKEAAAYISRRWFAFSWSTLAKLAVTNQGPPYLLRNGGGQALYTAADIDAWIPTYTSSPKARA